MIELQPTHICFSSINPTLSFPVCKTLQVKGVDVDRYLGIPYAEPPTGENRWKSPVYPHQPWSSVKQTSGFGAACM